MAPLMMPDRPNGSTAILIISHLVAPSASAASSCSRGVCRNTSRLTALMIGRIITASTRPATSIVRPVVEAGPAKSGMKPRLSASHWALGTVAGASTVTPHSP